MNKNYQPEVFVASNKLLIALKQAYSLDIDGPNFQGTARRMAESFEELITAQCVIDNEIRKLLEVTFPCSNDDMVVVHGIRAHGLCPHHMHPVDYTATAGYIPSKAGRVLGLSKIPRIFQWLVKQPTLQEQITGDMADALHSLPECQGAACYTHAVHHCMTMRGPREHAAVTTVSAVRGEFMSDQAARNEFLALARGN